MDLQRGVDMEFPIKLDVGCGEKKHAGFVGMDRRKLADVDIVHDLEVVPYPLPDGCCVEIVASHVYEHLKPWLSLVVMDEWWRLLMPDGVLVVTVPYGVSARFVQDPTHCNPANEHTWEYFDPRFGLYRVL